MKLFRQLALFFSNLLRDWSNFGEFFLDDKSKTFSMGRLVTFMVISTLCLDAFWSLVFLSTAWDFTVNKLLFGLVAITGKVGEKIITNWDLGSINIFGKTLIKKDVEDAI